MSRAVFVLVLALLGRGAVESFLSASDRVARPSLRFSLRAADNSNHPSDRESGREALAHVYKACVPKIERISAMTDKMERSLDNIAAMSWTRNVRLGSLQEKEIRNGKISDTEVLELELRVKEAEMKADALAAELALEKSTRVREKAQLKSTRVRNKSPPSDVDETHEGRVDFAEDAEGATKRGRKRGAGTSIPMFNRERGTKKLSLPILEENRDEIEITS